MIVLTDPLDSELPIADDLIVNVQESYDLVLTLFD